MKFSNVISKILFGLIVIFAFSEVKAQSDFGVIVDSLYFTDTTSTYSFPVGARDITIVMKDSTSPNTVDTVYVAIAGSNGAPVFGLTGVHDLNGTATATDVIYMQNGDGVTKSYRLPPGVSAPKLRLTRINAGTDNAYTAKTRILILYKY